MKWNVSVMAGLALTAYAFDGPEPATRKVEVSDSKYQTAAFSLEIPTAWKFAGDIFRPVGCHAFGPGFPTMRFTAQAPDGVTALVLLPGATWTWRPGASPGAGQPGSCPDMDIASAAGYLLNIALPSLHPEARIVSILPPKPEQQAALKDQLDKQVEALAAGAKEYGGKPPNVILDSARVRIEYQREGQPVEEMLSTVMECFELELPAVQKQPVRRQRTCNDRGVSLARAPQGHLDELIQLAQDLKLVASLHADPDWQKRALAEQQAANSPPRASDGFGFRRPWEENEAKIGEAHAVFDALDHVRYKDPLTGEIIPTSSSYHRMWHSADGPDRMERFGPMGDFRPVHDTVNQIWMELPVK